MTDFLHRFAARAMGAAPLAHPIVPALYAPSRGLERIEAPVEFAAIDREIERPSSVLSTPDLRAATLPAPHTLSQLDSSRTSGSPWSVRSDSTIPTESALPSRTAFTDIKSEPDSWLAVENRHASDALESSGPPSVATSLASRRFKLDGNDRPASVGN